MTETTIAFFFLFVAELEQKHKTNYISYFYYCTTPAFPVVLRISMPFTILFWHSMPFLWNDQSIFMPIKRWSYNSLLLSSSLACSIGNFYYFSSLEIPASSLIGQMDRSWGFCDWNSVLALLYHKACNTFSHCTDWFYKRYFSFLFIYEYMKKEL